MRSEDNKGSILITLIVAMVVMAALGAAIYTMTTSSSFSELLSNRNDNAYQLAKSGIRYATDTKGTVLGDFLLPDNSKKFNLARNGDEVTSTGIVNEGTSLEARRVLKFTLALEPPVIPDLPAKSMVVANPANSITNDGTTITLGGNDIPQSYGAIWYNGNKTNGNCITGACNFGLGLRAYFEFTISSGTGDGFTFAIISAINNKTTNRTGGFSKTEYPESRTSSYLRSDNTYTSVAGGELMGYAGPGNTRTMAIGPGEGLLPPKMALEFDTYRNDAYTPLYLAGTRKDPSSGHVALMFWGDSVSGQTPPLDYLTVGSSVKHSYPLSSFDDNRHEAGPAGRVNGLGSVDYSVEDGQPRSCRIEIIRAASPEASGQYKYTINAWIEKTGALNTLQKSHLQDVVAPLTDATLSSSLRISNAFAYFTSDEHREFAKIFWGFTQGTGDATQKVPITNVNVFFINTAAACSYAISPASATSPSAGGTGSVALTTANDCYWMVSSLAPWISITSTPFGKGNGTINYAVVQNTGSARTGNINISGQTFPVTQAAPCVYALNSYSRNFTSAADNSNTVNVNTESTCPWTAVSNDAWIMINSGSSGLGNGTVNYGVTANNGPARTGTMTIAGKTFTVTQNSGCTYTFGSCPATFPVTGGTGSISITTVDGCTWESTDDRTWISTSPTSSSSAGSVTVTVDAYNGTSNNNPRTGTVTVSGIMGNTTHIDCTIRENRR